MWTTDSRRTLAIGLIGGLLGALLVTSMPAVVAAVGDPVRVGETAKGNATTVLRSTADPALRVVNTGGGEALDLRVGQGNRPLKVDSNKRIPKLNADRLDGRNADQLLRVASDYRAYDTSANGAAATAVLTAPTAGHIVAVGSVEVRGDTEDVVECSLAVSRDLHTTWRGHHHVTVHDAGGTHTSNYHNVCATNAVFTVSPGTYDVSVWLESMSSATAKGRMVWAIFVPFDGEGSLPESPEF